MLQGTTCRGEACPQNWGQVEPRSLGLPTSCGPEPQRPGSCLQWGGVAGKGLQRGSRRHCSLGTLGAARGSPRPGLRLRPARWAGSQRRLASQRSSNILRYVYSTAPGRREPPALGLSLCWGPDSPTTSGRSPRLELRGLPPEHHEASLPVLLAQVGGACLVMQHAFFGDDTLGG